MKYFLEHPEYLTDGNLAWLGPDGSEDLQLDKAALLPPLYLEATMLDPVVRPTNNPATTRIPLKICSCNPRISTKSSQVQLLWGPSASCNSKAQTKISHTRKNDNEEALLAF
ncbi:methyl-CPG-binding domain protein 02 [Prunus dulcis]|uniref:Methyl-CPG-binding domain protein 02 n=1 Tax=Prunus dulcis TaxID=3755 RepID=A0A4Y1R6C2_PRUDU|nr:methyl-CPG-binding domain protein 02 [Prunus dulcis]